MTKRYLKKQPRTIASNAELIRVLENKLQRENSLKKDKQVFSGMHFDNQAVSFTDYVMAYGEYLRRCNKG